MAFTRSCKLVIIGPNNGDRMVINFECSGCGGIFDCDVGVVSMSENSYRPSFEKEILCPKCGRRSMDEVFLTELGQSQLTEATFGSQIDNLFESEANESIGFGFYEGECQGCDTFTGLSDLGLCEECAGKVDRDLIRQREWDYSALAFGCPENKREDLRNEIISRYGKENELIVSKKKPESKLGKKRKPKKRRRNR